VIKITNVNMFLLMQVIDKLRKQGFYVTVNFDLDYVMIYVMNVRNCIICSFHNFYNESFNYRLEMILKHGLGESK
jgi:hypothetical protein